MDSLSIGINWGTKNTDPGLAYLNSNPPQLWLSADRYLSITGARALDGVNQHFKLASAVAAGSTKMLILKQNMLLLLEVILHTLVDFQFIKVLLFGQQKFLVVMLMMEVHCMQ